MGDPGHIALLDGQRYVVLRVTGAVCTAFQPIQMAVKQRLAGLPVSYPAQPHVTLAGLARGTSLDTLRQVVTEWASSVPPLLLETHRVSVFPSPFQIVVLQLKKTPALLRAMTGLRGDLQRRGLRDLAKTQPAEWIFHASVAYCGELNSATWEDTATWVDSLVVSEASCVIAEAEIVALDDGREYSGGSIPFAGAKPDRRED